MVNCKSYFTKNELYKTIYLSIINSTGIEKEVMADSGDYEIMENEKENFIGK